jgi:hypothetical protein
MTLKQIKKAIKENKKVCWYSDIYQVIKDKNNNYLIKCVINKYCIGLTHKDKKTLNGKEKDFFIL